jgi:hypothetical protein
MANELIDQGEIRHTDGGKRTSSWDQEPIPPIVKRSVGATKHLFRGKRINPAKNPKKKGQQLGDSKSPDSFSSRMVENPIWKYLRDIGNIPLLTRKRELDVAKRIEERGKERRNWPWNPPSLGKSYSN